MTNIPDQDIISKNLRTFLEKMYKEFPYLLILQDHCGIEYKIGKNKPHWIGKEPLVIQLKSKNSAKAILNQKGWHIIEHFLSGDIELEGNLYLIPMLRESGGFKLGFWRTMRTLFFFFAFQNPGRAKENVKSHYDISQAALDVYLDKVYQAYSCAMYENPYDLNRYDMLRVGEGEFDDFDSLEKAQWKKFKDAIDYISPKEDESLLDIGCGYGGQLLVALENYTLKKVVGWTHSTNQVKKGKELLSKFESKLWEIHEGDYRNETRIFDHIISIGMISHVGPGGLKPYIQNVRKRIKKGGRYIHHSIMIGESKISQNILIGRVFNRKYVWPGFYWFTLREHVSTLEKNGFVIEKVIDLSRHYRKTIASWYERMVSQKEEMLKYMNQETYNAWRLYLAGAAGDLDHDTRICRLYCVAR